jgi:hypothetical protein
MTTIADLAQTLQEVLTTTADALARKTGFVQRASKLTGAAFAQALVFGWLATPHATVEALAQAAAAVGVTISPQGLDQRMGESAAVFMEELLGAAVRAVVAAEPVAVPVLERFTAVALCDSATVALPAALAPWWPGCGGGGATATRAAAALKLHVRVDLRAGTLTGPLLTDGRTNDAAAPAPGAPLPAGALRVADVGFFDLGAFRDMAARDVYWLSRLQFTTAVYDADGHRREALALRARAGGQADEADRAVTRGVEHRLPARLLAVRVPPEVANARRRRTRADAKRHGRTPSAARLAWCDWTLLVTNAPPEVLSLREALVLARARWQVELLFKLWKSHGHIDESRSARPWRVLCEVCAKLLAMVVPHWLLLVGCWAYPDRSLVKAAQTVRQHALALATALPCAARLADASAVIQRCLAAGCRINRRKQRPNTYQLLLDPALLGLG